MSPHLFSWLISERRLEDHFLSLHPAFPQPWHTSSAWLTYKLPSFSAQAPPATEITTLELLLSTPCYCGVWSPDSPTSPFLICTDAGASWQLVSFSFSHALGMLGSFVPRESLQPGRVFPGKPCICRAYVFDPGNYQMLWHEKNPRHITHLKDFFFLKFILLARKNI